MTANANPLLVTEGRDKIQPAFVKVGAQQVPTDIEAYCLWLNGHNTRRGRWVVVSVNGQRTIDWRPEHASDGWLEEQARA